MGYDDRAELVEAMVDRCSELLRRYRGALQLMRKLDGVAASCEEIEEAEATVGDMREAWYRACRVLYRLETEGV